MRGRKRILDEGLPVGLYRDGRQYRARLPGAPWVWFGRDQPAAIAAFHDWRARGSPSPDRSLPSAATMMRTLKKNAAARGLAVSITVADVAALLARAGGRCEVTRIPFTGNKTEGLRMRPWCPSIDRIERARGYDFDNCRVVCAYANLALNEFGVEPFRRLARAFLRANIPRRSIGSLSGPKSERALTRKAMIPWLPDLGSNQGPAD